MHNARVLTVALALLLPHCGSDDPAPAPYVEPKTVVELGPQATSRLTPFPSNRYTRADSTQRTGLRVDITQATTGDPFVTQFGATADQVNALDGFTVTGGVVFHTKGPVLEDSLKVSGDTSVTTQSPALLVDVDPKSPEFGKARPLSFKSVATDPEGEVPGDYAIVAQPFTPLLPRTTYAFVTTTQLKDASGASVGATSFARDLIDGRTTGGYAEQVKEAMVSVRALGLKPENLSALTVFTTGSVHESMLETAKLRRAEPLPKLTSISQATDEKTTNDPKRVRFVGTFPAKEYRQPKPDAKWKMNGDVPEVVKEETLSFYLDFADKSFSGKRPIVVFAHGLNGDKDGTWGTAERLSELNVAVIGIDSPEHGDRKASKDSFPTLDFFGIDAKTTTFDLGKARDNFRQMAMDQLELIRLIQNLKELDVLPLGAPDGIPDLDTTQIVYLGHSFGSVQGATAFALCPEIKGAVWNVGGAGLTTLLRDSNTFGFLVNSFRPKGTTDGDVARFFVMSQAVIDPGDPLNFAAFATHLMPPGVEGWTERSVLIQEVKGDTIVPNTSTEALARAARLVHVGPVKAPIDGLQKTEAPFAGATATHALFQFDMMEGKKAEHGGLIFTNDARAQYLPFFKDVLTGKVPVISNPQ